EAADLEPVRVPDERRLVPSPPPRRSIPSRTPAAVASPAETSKPPGSANAELPDATYYPARQLDVYPRLTSTLELRYSAKGGAANITGRTLLLVLIDEGGGVSDVSVVEADPPGYFDDDA